MSRTLFQNSQIAFLKMSALQRVLWARSLSPLVRRGDIRGGRRLVPAQLVISRRFRQIGLFLEMICQGLGQISDRVYQIARTVGQTVQHARGLGGVKDRRR
ncbi:MAG TPA: hypothetical protein PLG66_20685, partial [Calditrichia bacterium]|nr:hypothetical protein [Calditrichia bacterium]